MSQPGSAPDHGATTIRDLVRHHAHTQPDQSSYTFIPGVDAEEQTLTWQALDLRARAIAARLQAAGQAGRPVLLLHPPGLEYVACFLGCLYAGAIAVPAYPPAGRAPVRSLSRLSAIAVDSGASIALGTEQVRQLAESGAGTGLRDLTWISTAQITAADAAVWRETAVGGGSLALLQYTSGSTSSPKGVMVSNENLMHNLRAMHRHLGHDVGSAMVSWLPPFHDMGLIGGILIPAYGGFPAYLMAPQTFIARPLLWLETLSRTAATVSIAPNFGFEHCLRQVTPAQRDTLDLSRWRLALNGAEPVRADTLLRFAAYFAPCGFDARALMPCYGLAEATLMVTGVAAAHRPSILPVDADALRSGVATPTPPGSGQVIRTVGCGQAVDGVSVQIVGESTRRALPNGQVGEIWVSGPTVARGYWRRPADTRDVFRATIDGMPGTSWLRTGDLGFLREGSLHIAGRSKDVVIVQGRNYYPHDIEQTAEQASTAVISGQSAAFGIELNNTEQLVVACEVDRRECPHPPAILAAIRAAVAREHDVTPHAVLLLRRSSLPKTTSGKIQRRACRELFLQLRLPVIAASVLHDDEAGGTPHTIADDPFSQEILGVQPPDRKLADAGVDYPRLLTAVRQAEQRLDTRSLLGDLLVTPTAGALARVLGAGQADAATGAGPGRSAREIERWLVTGIADRLGLMPAVVDVTAPLAEAGLDSRQSVAVVEELSRWLGQTISPSEVFDHPSIRALSTALGSADLPSPVTRSPATDANRDHAEQPEPAEPIAIVGIGVRFPAAADVSAFWRLLADERDATGAVPPSRWDAERTGTPAIGGFLDHIDEFDASFFGVSAREAHRMDPQHRILLEVAWQALEDAGIAATGLAGSDTGVFIGISSNEYASLTLTETGADIHAATGSAHSLAANRISYLLDLRGPSMALDTACSSSLVAVHQACRAIRAGECRLALAGGVNMMLSSPLSVAFSRAGMLSPDGRCRAFDDTANGYVRGEGAGVVCLKTLRDALADGDSIYAVIRGSSTGHGGRGNGITAPRGTAQRAVIEHALAEAGVRPGQVAYVEAHGTGTPLGDPVEWSALAATYGAGRTGQPCLIGSVKSTIGHLEAAAGVAGLVKAALVLRHRTVPRQLQWRTLSRRLLPDSAGLSIPARPERLQADGVVHAAVSSFGFGGANAHLVLQSAPERPAEAAVQAAREPTQHALCLSGHTPAALATLAGRYRAYLAANPSLSLADVCHTASTGRSHLPYRAVAVAADATGFDAALESLARDEPSLAVATGHVTSGAVPRVAFLFSGQGTQYPGMGYALYQTYPRFATVLDQCDEILRPLLGQPLTGLLFSEDYGDQLRCTATCQPALVAFEIALANLWMALGVRPAAVLGHSIGSYAAAHIAGVMSLADALTLATVRGRHMNEQPGDGAMLACHGDADVTRGVAAGLPAVTIAAENAPDQLVLSGPRRDLEGAGQELASRGISVRPLAVSHAFHCGLMAGAAGPLRTAAQAVTFSRPVIGWVSDLSGEFAGQIDAEYWVLHMLGTIRFADGIDTLCRGGCDVFVEIGPHPALLAPGHRTAELRGHSTSHWLPSLRRDTKPEETFLRSLGQAHCAGLAVEWPVLGEGRGHTRVPLPLAVFERQPYWFGGPVRSGATGPDGSADGAESHTAAILPSAAASAGSVPTKTADATVRGYVARVSGFPVERIAPALRLGSDLGFDSLMKSELHRLLSAQFPAMTTQLRDDLPDDPSVAQITSLLGGEQGERNPAPAESPADTSARTVQRERRFEESDEYRTQQKFVATAEASGTNPYGRIHDGFNAGHAVVGGQTVINFSAFNYLALSSHPRVRAAATAAIEQYGTSSSATPLLCGETPLHHELDARIAWFLGTEAAIVFAGGHATNVATVGHMCGPDDLVLHDAWIHDSSIRGAMLSGALRRPFPHNNWRALDDTLAAVRDRYRRVLILIEGAYSQDGDIPELPEFIKVKKRHDAMLMVDEAHSIGVLGGSGRGVGEHFAVDRDDIDLWMGTLSKSLGSLGGYIAARGTIIEFLKYTAPLYIFSTGISPANAAAALEALRVVDDEPQRVSRLRALAEHLRTGARARGFDIGVSRASAVIPVIVGDWNTSMRISNEMLRRGVNVMPIGYPAVDRDKCRLRFFVNVDHSEADLDFSLDLLEEIMHDIPHSTPRSHVPPPSEPTGRHATADVLVTGASGFIGGHLARRLADDGLRVRVLARAHSDLSAIADVPVEVVAGDLGDTASLRAATAGVRYIYNCAGKSADWGSWEEFHSANVDGARNLVEAASRAGTMNRFVHVSSTDVYGYPPRPCDESGPLTDVGLPYNRSKVLGERAVRSAAGHLGVPLTIIRPVSVYGPGSKDFVLEIAAMLLKKQMVYISGGTVPAGLIYVTNLVDGMIAAAQSEAAEGEAYNMRDGDLTTWREYVEALAQGLGVSPPKLSLPGPAAMGIARTCETFWGALRIKSRPMVTRHAVRLFDRDQSYPIDRACADLGFKSKVSFEEGMRLTLDWLRSPAAAAALPALASLPALADARHGG